MYTASGKSEKKFLLEQHAPLVKRLAQYMKAKLPANVELDDLIQAGMIGLLDAVDRYEDDHGARFETYAAQRIRGAMIDELRNTDWLPRSIRKNMRMIEDAMHILQQRLGHPPTENDIAKQLNMSLTDYQNMLGDSSGHQLLYYEDFEDEQADNYFLEHQATDSSSDPLKSLIDSGFKGALVHAIDALPEREKLMMGLYYDQELNLKEIGHVMDVSESRVCQLHSQAIARLRSILRKQEWTGPA